MYILKKFKKCNSGFINIYELFLSVCKTLNILYDKAEKSFKIFLFKIYSFFLMHNFANNKKWLVDISKTYKLVLKKCKYMVF